MMGDVDAPNRGYHLPLGKLYGLTAKPRDFAVEHAVENQRERGRVAYFHHAFLVHMDLGDLREAPAILHAFTGTTEGDERATRNLARWMALPRSGEDPREVLALLCRDLFRPRWRLYHTHRSRVWTLTPQAQLNETFAHPA